MLTIAAALLFGIPVALALILSLAGLLVWTSFNRCQYDEP